MDLDTVPSEWLALLGLTVALLGLALWRVLQLQRLLLGREDALERERQAHAEAREALQALQRQRHELLARVSHDLRTPLASMQGYVELLLVRHGSLSAAEERNYLQTAARQGEKLTRLLADLFDLTRLEAGQWQAQKEDFSIAELAQDLLQKFEPEAQQRGLRLALDCQPPCTPATRVHADLALVARVLDSLLENALRHTPSGGRVAVELANADGRARLAVRDTGHGIAADELPGIFERYERASRVRDADHSEHAGLGLAIARHIVGLHGSRLEVRSTEGAGTCVSFALPLAEDITPRRIAA
ncbi:MAG: two-component sensor histidine kinase [Piscinibacter sp.]|uniref:sensor histidine kinase n=1 Tax=Piscinibacter sp. TaxID=1903157 RepID=UPI00258A53AE|nr:ATP-binding protein [Piscinibacter sp.]MCW5664368.1 two-component sensor histidine kinase [Piscinibacter sp.]